MDVFGLDPQDSSESGSEQNDDDLGFVRIGSPASNGSTSPVASDAGAESLPNFDPDPEPEPAPAPEPEIELPVRMEEVEEAEEAEEDDYKYLPLDDVNLERDRLVRQRMGLPGVDEDCVVEDEGDWDDEEAGRNEDPSFCFMCYVRTDPQTYKNNPYMARLQRTMLADLGRISPELMARDVQFYYNNELRPKVDLPDSRKVWRRATIIEHIKIHAPSPRSDALLDLDRFRKMQDVLSRTIVMQNSKNEQRVDASNLKLYLTLTDKKRGLAEYVRKLDNASSASSGPVHKKAKFR